MWSDTHTHTHKQEDLRRKEKKGTELSVKLTLYHNQVGLTPEMERWHSILKPY